MKTIRFCLDAREIWREKMGRKKLKKKENKEEDVFFYHV